MACDSQHTSEAELTEKIHQTVSVYIDASIFAGDAAYGRVSGNVMLPTYPQVGDFVSLLPIANAKSDERLLRSFSNLKVLSRTIATNSELNDVSLELSEIMTSDLEEAIRVASDLKKNSRLMIEIY